jgi:ABC-type nitrate/sulfonate/bicarbonate transport system permease component
VSSSPDASVARRAVRAPARTVRARRLRLPVDPLGLVGVVLLVAAWWLVAELTSPTTVPAPLDVVARIADEATTSYQMQSFGLQRQGYLGNLLYTATTVLLAVAVGSLIGVLVGLISVRAPRFRAALDPVVLVGGTVPVLIAAPFFLIWFGTERWVAYLIVGLYSAFTLIVYAQRAAENLDPAYEQNARTLGADRRTILRTVLLPGVLPEVLGGVRIALAAGWGLAAIAELLGMPAGLGKVVEAYATTTDTEAIFAAILLLGIAAVVVDTIVVLALRRLFRWRAGTERSTL